MNENWNRYDDVNEKSYETVKDKKGKPMMRLMLPEANAAVVRVREYGLEKYPNAENWRSVPTWDWQDAALRHLMKFQGGSEFDEESGLPHLWHALCDLSYMVEQLYPMALYSDPFEVKR